MNFKLIEGLHPILHVSMKFEFFIFKIILQKYTTVWKFYTFDNHSPWSTTVSGLTAVAQGGSEVPRGPPRAWRSAAVGHDGYRQTVVHYGGKANRRSQGGMGRPAAVAHNGWFL
jgi:hypothetical protein